MSSLKCEINYALDDQDEAQNINTSSTSNNTMEMRWKNLEVYYKRSRNFLDKIRNINSDLPKSKIIDKVSGIATSGRLLAIMGPSGSGKTTLLNALTYRCPKNFEIHGSIFLCSIPVQAEVIKLISCFVPQEDIFMGELTVKEHLLFQAALKMGGTYSRNERELKVDQIIIELGLLKCASLRIDSGTSISGGEKKRLAVASGILTNPAILFCDEPTSGLDSFMAKSIINVLKDIAAKNHIVICSIHQPSSEIFQLFDDLLFLSEGKVAYYGKASEAVEFFNFYGLQVPSNYNPAEFFMMHLAIVPGEIEESKRKIKNFCDYYNQSPNAKKIDSHCSQVGKLNLIENLNKSNDKASCLLQMAYLLLRATTASLRNPLSIKVKYLQAIFIALFLGFTYFQQDYNQEGIMNINGALFLILTNMSFSICFGILHTFTLELPLFFREYHDGLYGINNYYLSKSIVDLPIITILPIIFISILYWMVRLNNTIESFIICLIVGILISNTAAGYSYFLSTLSRSITVALSIAPPLLTPLMLFGGLFINNSSIPFHLLWIKYISWFYYGYEILIINQWQSIKTIECDFNSTFCKKSGEDVINSLHFHKDNITLDISVLILMCILFRILAYISLLIRAKLF